MDPPLPELVSIDSNSLGESGYLLLQPIPVSIQEIAPGDFMASFHEANIAIPGSDSDDAYQALVAEILDTFDGLTEEKYLGKSAFDQLQILKKYIAKT